MKPAPQLHPVQLLKGILSYYAESPSAPVKLEAQLNSADGHAIMFLARDDQGLQLHIQGPEAMAELRKGLRKMLNVWDIDAPLWLWQLDALCDAESRKIAAASQVR